MTIRLEWIEFPCLWVSKLSLFLSIQSHTYFMVAIITLIRILISRTAPVHKERHTRDNEYGSSGSIMTAWRWMETIPVCSRSSDDDMPRETSRPWRVDYDDDWHIDTDLPITNQRQHLSTFVFLTLQLNALWLIIMCSTPVYMSVSYSTASSDLVLNCGTMKIYNCGTFRNYPRQRIQYRFPLFNTSTAVDAFYLLQL